jgi:hypothetical protein
MNDLPKLRIKVREDLADGVESRLRVQVVDSDDNVLGDLAGIVPYDGVTYRLDARGVSILEVRFAVERVALDAFEVAGYNISKELTARRVPREPPPNPYRSERADHVKGDER